MIPNKLTDLEMSKHIEENQVTLMDKINELIDYLQAKEEASKVTIKNNRKFVEVETEPSKLYWSGEASKGECTCKLENNYHFTGCKKHKCYIDGFCDLCSKHKYSDPPEHEETGNEVRRILGEWMLRMRDLGELKDFLKKDSGFWGFECEELQDYIRDNFVAKSKIKREIKRVLNKDDGEYNLSDQLFDSLGLGD